LQSGAGAAMTVIVHLYVAKTNLSKLVERAAAGEKIVIAKAGKPKAKLVPYQPPRKKRRFGQNLFGITHIADDSTGLSHSSCRSTSGRFVPQRRSTKAAGYHAIAVEVAAAIGSHEVGTASQLGGNPASLLRKLKAPIRTVVTGLRPPGTNDGQALLEVFRTAAGSFII
jgi:prevent-host-death family protein